MHPGELLQSFTAPAAAVALGASPASYLAAAAGSLYVSGGTVTVIAHVRNGVSNTLGILSGGVRLRKGDTVSVTYAVIPTAVTFIPE
jgi:hypothetical protein